MIDYNIGNDIDFFNSSSNKENYDSEVKSSKIFGLILRNNKHIRKLENEINTMKTQMLEIAMKIPLSDESENKYNKNNKRKESDISESILKFKEDIKEDVMREINYKIEQEFKGIKEENIFSSRTIINKMIEEKSPSQKFNPQKIFNKKKNICGEIFQFKTNNYKKEEKNTTDIIQRLNNFDMDFDRLIKSLRNQFTNISKSINFLENNKVNSKEFEKQNEIINKTIKTISELEIKIDFKIKKNIEKQDNQKKINENSNNFFVTNNEIQNELMKFKNIIYQDFEKINLKILQELKNQAGDIKSLYQDFQSIDDNKKNNKIISIEEKYNLLDNSKKNEKKINNPRLTDIIISIKEELSKKANLEQLSFALDTQTKLNEAFSSATKISRFYWDSEGELVDDKYILWSVQNINTALDVFKWEKNSELITILQNGVYRIVVGIIGETKKKFGILLGEKNNKLFESQDFSGVNIINEREIQRINCFENIRLSQEQKDDDKSNIIFIEKYLACVENTLIRVFLLDNNKKICSEEAFIEIMKII